eukprot:Gb_35523 [translate_table: standard]
MGSSSSSSSLGKDASALQLAMAALVGASVMAVSAFYLHKRTVDQLLERTLEFRRQIAYEDGTVDDELQENGDEEENYKQKRRHQRNRRWRKPDSPSRSRDGAYCRSSSSMPDVTTAAWSNGGLDYYGKPCAKSPSNIDYKNRIGSFGNLSSIPPGLPRVHTQREGSSQSLNHPGSRKRAVASVIRPTTPKSPVASAFESVEGSDEEDNLLESQEDQNLTYDDAIGQSAAEGTTETNTNLTASSLVPSDLVNADGDQNQKSGTIMIRSHSVSGDFHGMHAPDPVAADILRKEPEQDTLVRLKITPIEAPTTEEEEVCWMMQECLALRDKYVFREKVLPWEKEIITDPSTPKANPDPFYYETEPASEHCFQMEDGVVHVYPNKNSKEDLFPVADSTTFFTDLHRILRITSLGNVRTVCHHRLRLLEQKFSLHLMLNADREFLAQKSAPHRDFYNVRKVDTHVHHSACMNQKHLLRFIKSKLRKEPDEVVIFRDGKYLTLKEVFESLDLTGYV